MNDMPELAMNTNAVTPRHQRVDGRTSDLVNQAIASIPTLGLQRAAEFLATMNVPAEVAVRVLVYPSRRRAN
ncbi:hypothetical protein AB2N08_16075 [Massilia aurea]|uniref:hypothetical protein n=1 Tax=Massilia aurea TaxID=373040 RepID=UPI0034626E9A